MYGSARMRKSAAERAASFAYERRTTQPANRPASYSTLFPEGLVFARLCSPPQFLWGEVFRITINRRSEHAPNGPTRHYEPSRI
jgi:hypothetical protein